MNLIDTPDYQWSLYKVTRKNAIWFSRQEPMTMALRKQADPKTGELTPRVNSCSLQEIERNMQEWITKMRDLWTKNQWQHHTAPSAAESPLSTSLPPTTTTITVPSATPYGVPDCYCPECTMRVIMAYKNPDVKVEDC